MRTVRLSNEALGTILGALAECEEQAKEGLADQRRRAFTRNGKLVDSLVRVLERIESARTEIGVKIS